MKKILILFLLLPLLCITGCKSNEIEESIDYFNLIDLTQRENDLINMLGDCVYFFEYNVSSNIEIVLKSYYFYKNIHVTKEYTFKQGESGYFAFDYNNDGYNILIFKNKKYTSFNYEHYLGKLEEDAYTKYSNYKKIESLKEQEFFFLSQIVENSIYEDGYLELEELLDNPQAFDGSRVGYLYSISINVL